MALNLTPYSRPYARGQRANSDILEKEPKLGPRIFLICFSEITFVQGG